MSHREITLLLPWYSTGRLAAEERQRVEAHLGGCPACLARLQEIRCLEAGLRDLGDASPLPGPDLLRRTLDRLPPRPRPIGDLWRRTPPAARFALAAQLLLLLALSAWIGRPQPPDFRTAGSGAVKIQQAHLAIAFAPQATAQEIRRVLQEVDGSIVAGPSANGLYKVVLRGSEETAAQRVRQARLQLAQWQDLVDYVEPLDPELEGPE